MHAEILPRISDIDPAEWDALVGAGSPFFEHAFLEALEWAGCVGPGTGWSPRHIVLRDGGAAVAAVAAYRKTDSHGEFVFDWSWAEAAHRAGLDYYPKLLVASPFSPVGGHRLHVGAAPEVPGPGGADALRRALIAALSEVCRAERMSGVHALFLPPDESQAFGANGFSERHGVQHHFEARSGERDFASFLGRFDSKRRHQIRRERRLVAEAGVTVRLLTGEALTPDLAPALHELYGRTVDKFPWGRRYLNERLFERLLGRWRHRMWVFLAERDGQLVGGSINGQKGDTLYGRYWGALADVPHLHFEVCSYAAIEACLAAGLRRFEAGAGGGEHKAGRGFEPTLVRSAHRLVHPGLNRAVAEFLAAERLAVASALEGGGPCEP